MRRAFTFVAIAAALAGPAWANTASYSDAHSYIGDPLAWSYVNTTRLEDRRRLLTRVRDVCNSRSYADKVRCNKALTIMRAGYAELQMRRESEAAFTE
jgi:hypothetical protein